MIRFADDNSKQQVWDMWKSVFGDSDDYMDIYFRTKYKNENTLVYIKNDKAVASLQMLPFQFSFCGTEIPILYLSGVSTLSGYRKKGYMYQLLVKSLLVALERGAALMLLVPQEEWLLEYYDKFGFAQTFDSGEEEFTMLRDMKELIEIDIETAYLKFDNCFRNQDVTIQKTFEDFKAIADEAKLYDYPAKNSLIGMARVINASKLLSIFASYYPDVNFELHLYDDLLLDNNLACTISNGKYERLYTDDPISLMLNIRQLSQLLLGYHTSELNSPLNTIFPEKNPHIHFMME